MIRKMMALIVAGALCASLAIPSNIQAAEINPSEDSSISNASELNDAIASVQNDSLYSEENPYIIELNNSIILDTTVSVPSNTYVCIRGTDDSISLTLDESASNLTQTAEICVEGYLELENIKLNANKMGRVIYNKRAKVVIEDGTYVSNGYITKTGSGIFNTGTIVMNGGTIENNVTTSSGGGIYTSGTFEFNAGDILDNQANRGAGVYNTGVLKIRNVRIMNNKASEANYGGGIFSNKAVSMCGKPNIQDNLAGELNNNLQMPSTLSEPRISITGSLEDASFVGFSLENSSAGAKIASGIDYSLSSVDALAFHDDTGSFNVALDTEKNALTLVQKQPIYGETTASSYSELASALANASDDSEKPTIIKVNGEIPMSGAQTVNGYVALQSGDSAGSVKMNGNAQTMFTVASGKLTVKDVTLDANQKGRVISVSEGAELDLEPGSVITGGQNPNTYTQMEGLGVYVSKGATLTMNGGEIKDNKNVSATKGIGVYNAGTFTMSAGSISGNEDLSTAANTSCAGMGVYNYGGTFTMTGGSIENNKGRFNNVQGFNGSGGAIYNADVIGGNAKVSISGTAKIKDNQANLGGAIYTEIAPVEISGSDVVISGNRAASGGAIYVKNSISTAASSYGTLLNGIVTISDAVIENNTAVVSDTVMSGNGAGIYVDGGTVNMSGGTIRDNYVTNDREASENEADKYLSLKGRGAGIYLAGHEQTSPGAATSTLNLTGGTITGNTGTEGNGIYAANFYYGISWQTTGPNSSSQVLYGPSALNISGAADVTDEITLAPAKLVEETTETGVALYPQVITLTGALSSENPLTVAKEFCEYENENNDTLMDNVVAQAGGEYASLTATDRAAIHLTTLEEDGVYAFKIKDLPVDPDDAAGDTVSSLLVEAITPEVTVEDTNLVYTGEALTPAVTVKNGETTLDPETDYDAEFADNVNAGTGSVTITLKDAYSGTLTADFNIGAKDLSDESISVDDIADVSYTGEAQTPEVTVKDGDKALTKDTDYTVSYADNTKVGTATVTVTGKGNYSGSVSKTFEIKAKTGWVQDGDDWYYFDASGNMVKNTWKQDSKGWCYLGTDGKMVTNGWAKDSKGWCWMGPDGYWVKNKWIQYNGAWYYIKSNGYMAAGEWAQVNGKWYYMNSSGVMTTGWQQVNGKWYYMNSSGVMTTGWQQVNGKWYYMNSSGVMTTGWQQVNGKWYYMNSSGVMTTGWQQVNGKWYYMNSSGVMTTGWQQISGKWYYMNSSGVMTTGWQQINGTWYYMSSSGVMVTGTQQISGKTYQFDSSGRWIS